MVVRRLGPDPHAHGAITASLHGCPDILELESGDFAVVGVDITAEAEANFNSARAADLMNA